MNDMKPTQRGMLHKAMGIHPGEKLGIAELMRAKGKAKRGGDSRMEKQAAYAEKSCK